MPTTDSKSMFRRLKDIVIGKSRDLDDRGLFHKVSLVALLAWVGLGADGLSSSCYGPETAFLALGTHTYLSLFVALLTVLTITIICASYSQIIELFPTGGGGYLVASKLLSPGAGLVSGCALVVDYILTIAISVASGADAAFSLLPPGWQHAKLAVALIGVACLTLINLRGVKESVMIFLPVFLAFIFTHLFAILYVVVSHAFATPELAVNLVKEVHGARHELGWLGMLVLILRAYSMGAGTFTGIEAVSNAVPLLREPRVRTGKRTMLYMGISLSVTVVGLFIAYLFFHATPQDGKTLNAVVFESMAQSWPAPLGFIFVLITLASEAALLFIAAQTGFLDGPSVLASMALDRWVPTRFASLSDRFVKQNGIVLMGVVALVVTFLTRGQVTVLVVLYSINVFITFSLSQLGMVRHWWQNRKTVSDWRGKLLINGTGFGLTVFILISLCFVKFFEGGWVTLLATGLLIAVAVRIRRHYRRTHGRLQRLDELVTVTEQVVMPHDENTAIARMKEPVFDKTAKTAVLLVSGFNGVGLHTLFGLIRMFPGVFKNYLFVQVGVVDAGNFKGTTEIDNLKKAIGGETDQYVQYMRRKGFFSESISKIGVDVVTVIGELAPEIAREFPNAVFVGGQLVFPEDRWIDRTLHNYAVFAMQRRLYQMGYPFLVLPIRV